MDEKKSIKFSIIIPTYNRAWCIGRAINSVFFQDFENWEMIIVDDGSIDDTKSIIKKYLSDSRIKYFYKENSGVGSARNFGIEKAIGEYCIFLDSDDAFYDNESLFKIFKSVMEYSKYQYFGFGTFDPGKGRLFSMNADIMIAELSDAISGRISGEFFPCVRLAIFKDPNNRFPEDINGGEGLLWWKILEEFGGVFFSSPVRKYYFDAENSITRALLDCKSAKNSLAINERMLAVYGEKIKKLNKRKYGEINLVIVRMLALVGRKRESIHIFFKNFCYELYDPKKLLLFLVALMDRKFFLTNTLIKIIYHRQC